MLIVLTSEPEIPNEAMLLNQLFEAGLEVLHFRKPKMSYNEHCASLNQIEKQYHNRIVVHNFHELINEYALKGIHFQEQKRRAHIDNPSHYFKELNMFGKTISSSFHEPEELDCCEFEFDYHFLSPVFSSISKKGYEGRGFKVNHIDKIIIGMGGINAETIAETVALGYKGVAVLGGIWNGENPVKSFVELKEKYDCHFELLDASFHYRLK